jgi:uncharacterized membrane protein YidH (DUF202 family)
MFAQPQLGTMETRGFLLGSAALDFLLSQHVCQFPIVLRRAFRRNLYFPHIIIVIAIIIIVIIVIIIMVIII